MNGRTASEDDRSGSKKTAHRDEKGTWGKKKNGCSRDWKQPCMVKEISGRSG